LVIGVQTAKTVARAAAEAYRTLPADLIQHIPG
jgi:hypothetical protein